MTLDSETAGRPHARPWAGKDGKRFKTNPSDSVPAAPAPARHKHDNLPSMRNVPKVQGDCKAVRAILFDLD
ncbi:MAG TPA: hypothetical protein VHP35_04090, partial [Terriglobia bacterium]|nr:hypothetical protein [Terriglobia bacterium]